MGAAIVNAANRDRPPARVRFVDLLDLEISLPLEFCFVAQEAAHEANPTLKRFLDLLK
jgi:predicted component of type VI protein secretion system